MTIHDLTRAVGLPVEEARDVLATRSFAAVVDVDWQRAAELRIRRPADAALEVAR